MKIIFACLSGVLFALASFVVSAHEGDHRAPEPVIIGYVFSPEEPLEPDTIAAEKLTHINYAFSNIDDGRIVNGFDFDDQNYR